MGTIYIKEEVPKNVTYMDMPMYIMTIKESLAKQAAACKLHITEWVEVSDFVRTAKGLEPASFLIAICEPIK